MSARSNQYIHVCLKYKKCTLTVSKRASPAYKICIGKKFLIDYQEGGRFATKPFLKKKPRKEETG